MLLSGRNVGVPHVHGHGLNLGKLLTQKLPKLALQALQAALIPHKLNRALVDIANQRLVFVPLGDRLLIHSYMDGQPALLAPLAPIHRPLQNAPALVPTQPAPRRGRLDAALLRHPDHKTLQMEGKLQAVLTELRSHLLDLMTQAVEPRRTDMNAGLHLTGVQVPIDVLRRMIVEPVKRIALRAAYPIFGLVVHVKVNPLRFVIDHHLLDEPGRP